MVKFNLIEETDLCVRYEYYPESTNCMGIVSYEKHTDQCIIEKLSEADKYKKYALKAMVRIREYAKGNSFPKTGCVMWY